MTDLIDFTALWQVVVIALVAGVGIVTVFSLGLVTITPATGEAAVSGGRRALGGLCFALCACAVAFGVWVMLSK